MDRMGVRAQRAGGKCEGGNGKAQGEAQPPLPCRNLTMAGEAPAASRVLAMMSCSTCMG